MMDDAKNTYKVPTPQDSLESQIMDPNFPKNEREWWASEEITRLRAEVESLKAEDARQRKLWQKENDELVQILGKALQYPRFAADQSVFPGATEADGVCVPCHTALSIADEAAEKIEALRDDAERYRWLRARPLDCDEIYVAVDSDKYPNRWGLRMAACDAAIDAARAAQGVE